MPIITCPKCQGKLRLPDDGKNRRVKCPTCGDIFTTHEMGNEKTPPTIPAIPTRNESQDTKVKNDRIDRDNDDDRPRRRDRDDEEPDRQKSRRYRDDEDEDDRPRTKRRRDLDDDDLDDRPRSKRRSRVEDDDDYDRPSRRRRDDRDDDDYYDSRSNRSRDESAAKEARLDRAAVACLLNFIGGWIQVGALGLVFFATILAWADFMEGINTFIMIAGILGLAYWLTSGTGFGIAIAGPRENGALGLSIAIMVVASFHLILLIVNATVSKGIEGPLGRTGDVSWRDFITSIHSIGNFLMIQIGLSDFIRDGTSSRILIPFVVNLLEIARGILFILYLKSLMRCTRDKETVRTVQKGLIAFCIYVGCLVAFGILFGLIVYALAPARNNPGRGSGISSTLYIYNLLTLLMMTGMMVWINLIVKVVKGNLEYRR